MAKYMIHSVDGGYVPPMEKIDVSASSDTPLTIGTPVYYEAEVGSYQPGSGGDYEYVLMSSNITPLTKNDNNGLYESEAFAIRVSPNIVFEDENGNRVRLA